MVLDRETAPRDRNWGVTISWSHPDIEKLLPEEVWKRIKECQPDPNLDSKEAGCESVLVRDGKTGEKMIEVHFPGIRRLNIQKTKSMWHNNLNIKVWPCSYFLCPVSCLLVRCRTNLFPVSPICSLVSAYPRSRWPSLAP